MQIITHQATKAAAVPQGGKLLDRFWLLLMERGFAPVMAEQHVAWARGYIVFHGTRHPQELGGAEARQYLEHVGETKGCKDREQARAVTIRRMPITWVRAGIGCRLMIIWSEPLRLHLSPSPELPPPGRSRCQERVRNRFLRFDLPEWPGGQLLAGGVTPMMRRGGLSTWRAG